MRNTLRLAIMSLFASGIIAIAQTAPAQTPRVPPAPERTGGSDAPPSAAAFWFRQYCGSCHGVDGTGNGPVAPSLRTKPTDLTLLSQKNGGVFPEQEVHDFIDGTKWVAAHGPREMPVWGMPTTLGPGSSRGIFKPELTQKQIDVRIDFLLDYIKSIQKK
jgi:mono/diheme cytochrome c family protein